MEDQASSLQLDLIVPVTDVKRTESNRDEKEKCAAVASKSPEKSQLESPALGKTSENVGSSQHDPIGSSEESTPSSVQIDTETKSNDATQECKGLPDAESNVDFKSHAAALLDSGSKAEAMPEPVPVERIFSIEVFYEDSLLKSLTVESSDKNSANQSSADMSSSEQTKHTANGVAELCNFMITHFSAMLEETITTMSGGRSPRGKMGRPSPEPGFSGDIDVKKSGRRSNKSGTNESCSTDDGPEVSKRRARPRKRPASPDKVEPKPKVTVVNLEEVGSTSFELIYSTEEGISLIHRNMDTAGDTTRDNSPTDLEMGAGEEADRTKDDDNQQKSPEEK